MRITIPLLFLAPALIGVAWADLPRKAPLTKYSGLWSNSPFTSKPPPPEQVEAPNPLEDYALAGVSPIAGGYRVTMLNRNNPEERIIVDSDRPRDGFKILGVNRKDGDPLATVVQMESGSVTGTISFDESLLTLIPPPAPQPQPRGNPQLPPGLQPGQAQPPGQGTRQPRPRVVPPNPQNPQAQPQPQAAPQQPQAAPQGRGSQDRRSFQPPTGRPTSTERPGRRSSR